MTSNLGTKELLEATRDGSDDGDAAATQDLAVDQVKAALEEAMKPEFLNRIDEIVVFSKLSFENLKEISTYLIEQTVKRAKEDQNIQLDVSENIVEIVTREGYSVASMYGARPIRRSIQRFLEDTLAEAIMDGFIDEGDSVSVNLHDPNGQSQSVVKITRKIDGQSVFIDVDADAGIGPDAWAQAAYGDIPSLDDGPPKRDPSAFQ
jgi:ATP-dependent Clp protease ATP-binding subunit ClpA